MVDHEACLLATLTSATKSPLHRSVLSCHSRCASILSWRPSGYVKKQGAPSPSSRSFVPWLSPTRSAGTPASSPTPMTNPFRAPTAQEWIAQNAPAPPLGPVPPLPIPTPTQGPSAPPRGSQAPSLALEQLYGRGAEGLLGEVVDNPDFSPEHQALALAVLAGDKPMKKLDQEDRNLLDEIAYQMAGTSPKGHRPSHRIPTPQPPRRPMDEGTSFTRDEGEDVDPDQSFSPSDSDKRG